MTPAVAVLDKQDRQAADIGFGVGGVESLLAGYPREPPKVCVVQSANLTYTLALTVV